MKLIVIKSDGLCDCSQGDVCPLGRVGMQPRCSLLELFSHGVRTIQKEPIKMHTQLVDDMTLEVRRDQRMKRLKRALAWCGVVAAGSLLVFAIGLFLMQLNLEVLIMLAGLIAIIGIIWWGCWGLEHLSNKR